MGGSTSKELVLDVFVGTWNQGNNAPTDLSWIPNSKKDSFDVYVIGIQEGCYEPRKPFLNVEQDWFVSLQKHIGEDKYEIIGEQTLTPRTDKTYKTETSFMDAVEKGIAKTSGIRISVYATKKLAKEIKSNGKDLEVLLQTCGRLNGVSGNKGGCAVSFRLGATQFTFIASHLNAQMEELERRFEDYQRINEGLHRPETSFGNAEDEQDPDYGDESHREIEVANRSDYVVWLGDLNYRVELPLATEAAMTEEVLELIKEKRWDTLYVHDQLRVEQTKQRSFAPYKEPKIEFPPTFKIEDGGKYNKKRVPSYCDRILYWQPTGYPAPRVLSYTSHPEITSSDHRPVSAHFQIPVFGIPKDSPLQRVKSSAFVLEITKLTWEHSGAIVELSSLFGSGRLAVEAVHQLVGKVTTKKHAHFDKPAKWDEGLEVRSAVPATELALYPLCFAIRNLETIDPKAHKVGEGSLRLHVLPPSGEFNISLHQRGLPTGTLRGVVSFKN